ncbi:MAG: hypothetical protein AAGI68_15180 [Planctomycetota bacterium]
MRMRVLVLMLVAWVGVFEMGSAVLAEPSESIRGITISTRRWGPGEWDRRDLMGPTLDRANGVGANWITIHPYARLGRNGRLWHDPAMQDASVRVTMEEARERSVKVMIKPHIAYWGTPFTWRGEITYGDDEAAWQRFFAGYQGWIVHQAALAQRYGAEAFCIGLEYVGTMHREAEWRAVIAAVRAVYDGPITYGANFDEYTRVPFWDAVDVIGVLGYFPLSQQPNPSDAELDRGWRETMKTMRAFSVRHGKPIVFVEIGYPRSSFAASKPWRHDDHGPDLEEYRLRVLRSALRAVENEPTVLGAFVWKWFAAPGPVSEEFILMGPQAMATLRTAWGDEAADRP